MSIAFLFPGQGSQSVGMLSALAQRFPEVESTFSEASMVLGYDLWSLAQNGPAEELAKTAVTQPLMLTSGVALWRLWKALGEDDPDVMAGHSLGEYTALVCAGSIPFEQAVALVQKRGEFMQQAVAVGQGGMVAVIGPIPKEVEGYCEQAANGEILSVANYNSPVQTVVAGSSGAIARLIEIASNAGAKKVVELPVSAPFHCALMEPAADKLLPFIEGITLTKPKIPVVNNVDVAIVEEPAHIRDALIRQVVSPVRWVELIEKIVRDGAELLVECGPGKVLMGLNKRISRDSCHQAIFDVDSLEKVLEALPTGETR